MTKFKIIIVLVLLVAAGLYFGRHGGNKSNASVTETTKPALTVSTIKPEKVQWAQRVIANGSVLAWQEASIGSELGGVRLVELRANIGDRVKKGDLLARFTDETLQVELHQQQAALDEAIARYNEASDNAQRASAVRDSGVMSVQEVQQMVNSAEITQAQKKAAEARLENTKLKLQYSRIIAPDDGVISARNATLGMVASAGSELFRLIRQDKLEWRAELNEVQMQKIHLGQRVRVISGNNDLIEGSVVRIAPSVDTTTRNGYVFVGFKENKMLRAGMFVQGEFDIGTSGALTVPQAAVVFRDGYAYIYRIGQDGRVIQAKVTTGRRQGDRVEVISGLAQDTPVVSSGAGFLNDGDPVRVEQAANKGI